MWMQGKGLGNNARKLINAFGTIKSMDVVVPVKRGNIELSVRLRTVAKPEEDVAVLLAHLGMIGIRFCPVSATRARGIVAGRAKGRIAFEGSEHGADLFAFNLVLGDNSAICHRRYVFSRNPLSGCLGISWQTS